jgi:hypothetical protein
MVPAVRTFVDYLVEMLDPDTGKHITGECPVADEKKTAERVVAAQAQAIV